MKAKLLIGVPFGGRFVPPEWAMGIAAMQFPTGTSRMMAMVKGQPRAQARTDLIKAARAAGCQYILFLDDDTVPPPHTVPALINVLDQSDDDVAVCAGIYTNKRHPVAPLVYQERGMGSFWKWKYNEVFPCWGIATGCMMIRLSCFDNLPEPWFRDIDSLEDAGDDPTALPNGGEGISDFHMTDDLYFCEKLKNHGFKVLAHGGVLPVHISQKSEAFVLPPDSYPLKDVDTSTFWYRDIVATNPPR